MVAQAMAAQPPVSQCSEPNRRVRNGFGVVAMNDSMCRPAMIRSKWSTATWLSNAIDADLNGRASSVPTSSARTTIVARPTAYRAWGPRPESIVIRRWAISLGVGAAP